MNSNRRNFIAFGGASLLGMMAAGLGLPGALHAAAKGKFRVSKTDAEWRKILSPAAYAILRQEATEAPYSSRLDKEKRKGLYVCKGCNQRLYSSATKYDSGTGWPSFYRPIAGGVGTSTDYVIGYPRTEVHCARCGGHLGHVFDDGPKPTGKRYCMNGAAMRFIAAKVA
jgi:peptide-methionine (R)-S-oxide reductase